jgi:hypothetical protein
MVGRRGTTDNDRTTDGSSADGHPSAQPPSTVGGWARAIGWGALAVAGWGAILLLVAPGELAGADPPPCEEVRDQASCRLVEQAVTATVPTLNSTVPTLNSTVPTWISTPGQVPFARSPNP